MLKQRLAQWVFQNLSGDRDKYYAPRGRVPARIRRGWHIGPRHDPQQRWFRAMARETGQVVHLLFGQAGTKASLVYPVGMVGKVNLARAEAWALVLGPEGPIQSDCRESSRAPRSSQDREANRRSRSGNYRGVQRVVESPETGCYRLRVSKVMSPRDIFPQPHGCRG